MKLPSILAACSIASAFAAEKPPLPLPTANQAAWLDAQIGIFMHWSPSVYQGNEGDNLSTPRDRIHPDRFDAAKVVEAAKSAGAGYFIFVAKHMGGYCAWQTETTDYSLKSSPWKNGKADMVGDLAKACRDGGLRFGVYLSPRSDIHKFVSGGHAADAEKQKEYNEIYRRQLTEILTNYGPMFEMWPVFVSSAAAEESASPPGEAPAKKWFVAAIQGETMAFPQEGTLAAKDITTTQAALWADYKSAAIELGWDKEISESPVLPKLPPMGELSKMPAEERPKIPPFNASVMPCGEETMPYLLFSCGKRPENGWPLFFQTHGGGGTDKKLKSPHGWEVNTQDWQAQVGVCLFSLPEGMYFVPRMANDNKGRWWMKHNHIAFDKIIRRAILFREVDPDRIYMMGISEGAYGTEAMTPFWGDRFAGGCALAGGAGGGERFYNLRNTAFRSDNGENDTMFKRIELARQTHDYLADLKKKDPDGYDHSIAIQAGRGHGIDYKAGPAWIATKTRTTRPAKVCWFNFALDGQRRTDFSWLSLAKAPERDTLITAGVHRAGDRVEVTALINPPDMKDETPVYNQSTPPPVGNRIPYTGNILIVHLDDQLLDLDKPVTVLLNGKEVFNGPVERKASHMADDIARHGDPGRVFPARVEIKF